MVPENTETEQDPRLDDKLSLALSEAAACGRWFACVYRVMPGGTLLGTVVHREFPDADMATIVREVEAHCEPFLLQDARGAMRDGVTLRNKDLGNGQDAAPDQ